MPRRARSPIRRPRPPSRSARPRPSDAVGGQGAIPDARDGLTRLERIILVQLSRLQAERAGGPVPTAMLYGRVVEQIDIGVEEFQAVLARLTGR